MNQTDIAELMKGIAPVVRDYVVKAVAPLAASQRELERALRQEIDRVRAAGGNGALEGALDGIRQECRRDISLMAMEGRALVAEARTELSDIKVTMQDERRHHGDEIEGLVATVASRVEAIRDGAPGEPGRDGKDADPAEIAERLIPEVERVVAAIPAPRDGKDADPAEVAGLVASEVGRAVSGLPVPKDGRDGVDGKDAVIPDAPDDVAYQVTRALAILEEPTILFPPVASLVNERPKLRSVVKQKGGKLVLQYEGED